MPSKLYNNATLAEQERKRKLGVEVEPQKPSPQAANRASYDDEPSADQLLREAHGSLDRANTLSSLMDTESLQGLEGKLAGLKRTPHGTARQITDALEAMTGPAALASFVPGPQQPIAAAIGGAGIGLSGLRKAIMPEPDESRGWGAAEAAMGLLPGLKSLKRLVRPAQAAEEALTGGASLASKELPYRMGEPTGVHNFPPPRAPEVPTPKSPWERPSFESPAKPAPSYTEPPPEPELSPGELFRQSQEQFGGIDPEVLATMPEGRAMQEISHSGAQAYMNSQYAKNHPIAREILGEAVNPANTDLPASWQKLLQQEPDAKLAKLSSAARKTRTSRARKVEPNPQQSFKFGTP